MLSQKLLYIITIDRNTTIKAKYTAHRSRAPQATKVYAAERRNVVSPIPSRQKPTLNRNRQRTFGQVLKPLFRSPRSAHMAGQIRVLTFPEFSAKDFPDLGILDVLFCQILFKPLQERQSGIAIVSSLDCNGARRIRMFSPPTPTFARHEHGQLGRKLCAKDLVLLKTKKTNPQTPPGPDWLRG